jgi:hypothetical protein
MRWRFWPTQVPRGEGSDWAGTGRHFAGLSLDLFPALLALRDEQSGRGRSLSRTDGPLAHNARARLDHLGGAGRSHGSDCHAWGASPNYELFPTVLGIDSASPGFRRVVVRPFFGRRARRGNRPSPQRRSSQ